MSLITVGALVGALKGVRRTRRLSLIIILTLGIAIGLLTTFFSFLNTAVWRELPYPDADQIIALGRHAVSRAAIVELAQSSRALKEIATFDEWPAVVVHEGSTWEAPTSNVDSNFFRVLGVQPVRGTLPTPREIADGAPFVVISAALWKTNFAGRTDIIGTRIRLGEVSRQIVAVMPRWFSFPSHSSAWIPFPVGDNSSVATVSAIARLASQGTFEQVQLEAQLVNSRLRTSDPTLFRKFYRYGLLSPSKQMVDRGENDDLSSLAGLALGGAGFVLLVACLNVAVLMMARTAKRRGELVIRAALGASHWQLAREQLLEAFVLGTAGGMVGIIIAVWLTAVGPQLMPSGFIEWLPGWVQMGVDWRVLLFAAFVSLLTVSLFGLAPTREALRLDIRLGLRTTADHGAVSSDVRERVRFPVMLQISLSVVLFVASITMLRAAREYTHDLGYSIDGLLTLRYTDDRDSIWSRYTQRYREIGQRLRLLGMDAALITGFTGLSDSGPRTDLQLRDGDNLRELPDAYDYPGIQIVSDNYFEVLGVPLLAGRSFGPLEAIGPPTAAIVSRRFAVEVWGTTQAVGKTLMLGAQRHRLKVVGVAAGAKRLGLVGDRAAMVDGRDVFLSERQGLSCCNKISFRVRSRLAPGTISAAAVAAAQSVGYDLAARATPVAEARGPAQLNRVLAVILGVFAGVGLALSLLGLYGVVAFSVERRQREIGVRVALGATSRTVVALIMADGARIGLLGSVVGFLASAGLGRLMSSFMLASLGGHIATAAAMAFIFFTAACIACYLPARRAGLLDPAVLLRNQ